MELPVPPWFELFHTHSKQFTLILAQELGPEVKGSYEHWDHLRHLTLRARLRTSSGGSESNSPGARFRATCRLKTKPIRRSRSR